MVHMLHLLLMYIVLDLLTVHDTHAACTWYTHASTIGLVLLYYFLGDIQCLSECFVCPCSNYPNCCDLTTLNWQLEHTWELEDVCTV